MCSRSASAEQWTAALRHWVGLAGVRTACGFPFERVTSAGQPGNAHAHSVSTTQALTTSGNGATPLLLQSVSKYRALTGQGLMPSRAVSGFTA